METPLRILFADDEDSFRLAVTNFLVGNGYVVEGVASGSEAVDALRRSTFDVIILDQMMPGMSGLNVLQWMLEQKNQTPTILLTGSGSEDLAVEAMKLGAFDYIAKERLDLHHLPIIVNGVNERNLFRKEKEERNRILRSRESITASIDTFEKAIVSLSHVANNSLTLLSLNLEEYIREHVVPYQTDEARRGSEEDFVEIKRELEVIASTVKAMRNLTTAMQERLQGETGDASTDRALNIDVEARMAQHKSRMNEQS
jgi:DNA-binding response OmpR family regulator